MSAPTLNSQSDSKKEEPNVLNFEVRVYESLSPEARGAFDVLVQAGCDSRKLAGYVSSLRISFFHHDNLQNDTSRIKGPRLKSLIRRTRTVAKDWDKIFHSSFGQEVLEKTRQADFMAAKTEYHNIPQRLRSLCQFAEIIHKRTEHRRRPLYDDLLADLLVYVENATTKSRHKEVSALVADVTGKDDYTANELGVWKHDHLKSLKRARVRLQNS